MLYAEPSPGTGDKQGIGTSPLHAGGGGDDTAMSAHDGVVVHGVLAELTAGHVVHGDDAVTRRPACPLRR